MFNPYAWNFQSQAWNFQSRLKISISIENFNPDLDKTPQKGALLCGSLEIFNLDWKFRSEIGRLKISIPERNLEFFQSLGPLGMFLAKPSVTFVLSFFGGFPLHKRKGIPLPTRGFPRGSSENDTCFDLVLLCMVHTKLLSLQRPCPSFPCFWDSLFFSLARNFPCFWAFFPSFQRFQRFGTDKKSLFLFWGGLVSLLFFFRTRKEGPGTLWKWHLDALEWWKPFCRLPIYIP